MKSFVSSATIAGLAGLVSAKHCREITVPVTISGRNAVFDQTALTPRSNIDVTNFMLQLSRQGGNYSADQLKGYANVQGTYHLATTYCAPDSGAPKTVQLLIHGIGFDRSYWNVPFNNFNYSYINQAVDHYGYATFSYDRLGIGMSQHGEPVNEIQTGLELAALKTLTDMIRAGSISGVPKFEKVIHIGHSFGSVQTYALTAAYPDISDGIALTGFSQNGTFLPFFELGGNFVQANSNPALSQYPDGYLTAGDATAVQTLFFAPGDFDPKILTFATNTGEPVAIGEILTIGGADYATNELKAPVLIITGEYDVPYCGGDCYAAPTGYTSIPETSKINFPNASPFMVDIVKGAGHGLNLQYTHSQTYAAILDFFAQNGPTSNGTVKSRDGGSDNKRNPGGMGGRGGKGGMRGHYGKREDDLTSGHTVMQIVDRQIQDQDPQ